MNLVEGADAVIELVKDVEEALVIVRQKAQHSLGLTLKRAELEIEISTQSVAKAGGKLDFGISLDASIKRARSHTHVLSLTLEPTAGSLKMGWEETHDLADSIVALAGLRSQVKKLGFTDFKVGDMTLEIHVEKKTSGGLQIVGGGEGESGNTQKVTLYFRE
jgi:Trypsin-co-occurring domain 2